METKGEIRCVPMSHESARLFNQNHESINVNIGDYDNDSEFDISLSANETSSESSIKSIVLGGLDGIITSYTIICAASGGSMSWTIVLVVGIATVLCSGLTVGINEYLSSKAHKDFLEMEISKRHSRLRENKEREIQQVVNFNIVFNRLHLN